MEEAIRCSVDARYQLNEGVGFHFNVQCMNIGKASEEATQHFDLLEDAKIHNQSQDLDAWYYGAWTRLCFSLQCNVKLEMSRRSHCKTDTSRSNIVY